MKWTTKDGIKMDVSEMDDNHLLNSMKLLLKKSEEGILDGYSGLGYDGDYGDCWTIYGEEALSNMGFYGLKAEADRRGLSTQPSQE